MAPLIVLLAAWAVFGILGSVGVVHAAATWVGALRFALAAMFTFTALSHFIPRTRADLVRMVPPQLSQPGFWVTLTGILELAGALGLLLSSFYRPAAYALIALLIAMFPANIHAARARLMVAGRPATRLSLRLPLQVFWIGALWMVARS